jgi:hypothetical protein
MNEKEFLFTLKEYLESEGELEILDLMNPCELNFNNTSVLITTLLGVVQSNLTLLQKC